MVWGYDSFYILLCQCVRINKLWDIRTKYWGNHVGILFVVPDFLMSTKQVLLYMYSLVNGFISTNYNWKALTGSCFYCPLFHQTSKSTFIVPYSIMCIVFLISNSCFNHTISLEYYLFFVPTNLYSYLQHIQNQDYYLRELQLLLYNSFWHHLYYLFLFNFRHHLNYIYYWLIIKY